MSRGQPADGWPPPPPAGRNKRPIAALIGDLIRAAETLAIRCDELAGKVSGLERALRDVVEVMGEDLIAVRAALTLDVAPGSRPIDPPPADDV